MNLISALVVFSEIALGPNFSRRRAASSAERPCGVASNRRINAAVWVCSAVWVEICLSSIVGFLYKAPRHTGRPPSIGSDTPLIEKFRQFAVANL